MFEIKPRALSFLESLPVKDRRIVAEHIDRIESKWPPAGDLERLYGIRYRMHVSHRYTIFIEHEGKDTSILQIMTIEQAHKRYGKI